MPEIKPLSPEIKKRVLQMQTERADGVPYLYQGRRLCKKPGEQGDAAENSQ